MSAYLATSDVDALIGANERQALFSDDNTVAGYSVTYFTSLNEKASAVIQSAAKNAGYTLGATTTDDLVKLCTLGQIIAMAYGRKGLLVPSQWQYIVDMRTDLINGNLPLSMSPDAADAVGGLQWSDQTSTTGNGGRVQIFSRLKLQGY